MPSIKFNFQLPVESFEEDKPKDLNFEVSGVPEARIVVLKNGQRLQPNEYVDIGELF